jgi:hypothetical protein
MQPFLLLLLLLASLFTLSQAQQHPLPFSLCAPDKLGLHSIALNEWPVVPGKDVVITASYTPNITVTGGKALATGWLGEGEKEKGERQREERRGQEGYAEKSGVISSNVTMLEHPSTFAAEW